MLSDISTINSHVVPSELWSSLYNIHLCILYIKSLRLLSFEYDVKFPPWFFASYLLMNKSPMYTLGSWLTYFLVLYKLLPSSLVFVDTCSCSCSMNYEKWGWGWGDPFGDLGWNQYLWSSNPSRVKLVHFKHILLGT